MCCSRVVSDVASGRKLRRLRQTGALVRTDERSKIEEKVMLLTFLLICFGGLAFMFYSIQKMQEKMFKTMQEEHAQLRTVLRALEARLNAVETASESVGQAGAESELVLEGATVAQAAEMLRNGASLNDMNLRMDTSDTLRKGQRREAPMPDINL